jgi:hypothetical protein
MSFAVAHGQVRDGKHLTLGAAGIVKFDTISISE